MDEILELNKDFFASQDDRNINLISVEKMIRALDRHKIVRIHGLSAKKKTASVLTASKLLGIEEQTFYFNSQIYKNSRIKNAKGLAKLLKYSREKQLSKNISLLVFESVEDIEGVKEYISQLYTEGDYKIVLIGALKKLSGLPTLMIPLTSVLKKIAVDEEPQLQNYMQLGGLFGYNYNHLSVHDLTIRDALKDSIILQGVIVSYGLKDVFLYQSTLNFIARSIGKYLSLRDITKILNEGNLNTSVITITDYIHNSVSAGILHKIKKYDFKKEKEMMSKGSYYFGDLGLLASFKMNTVTPIHRLMENTIFLELIAKGYSVQSGVNGKFDFSFYIQKLGAKKCIHVTKSTDKKELKKDINKLAKIPVNAEKFLIVYSREQIGLRKKDYDTVQLLSFVEILKRI